MAGPVQPFLVGGGTFAYSASTVAPLVALSSGTGIQGALVSNLSTLNVQILFSPSSVTTISTLSTDSLVVGTVIGPSKQMTLSIPPQGFFSAMTTGTGLSGILTVTLGAGLI